MAKMYETIKRLNKEIKNYKIVILNKDNQIKELQKERNEKITVIEVPCEKQVKENRSLKNQVNKLITILNKFNKSDQTLNIIKKSQLEKNKKKGLGYHKSYRKLRSNEEYPLSKFRKARDKTNINFENRIIDHCISCGSLSHLSISCKNNFRIWRPIGIAGCSVDRGPTKAWVPSRVR